LAGTDNRASAEVRALAQSAEARSQAEHPALEGRALVAADDRTLVEVRAVEVRAAEVRAAEVVGATN